MNASVDSLNAPIPGVAVAVETYGQPGSKIGGCVALRRLDSLDATSPETGLMTVFMSDDLAALDEEAQAWASFFGVSPTGLTGAAPAPADPEADLLPSTFPHELTLVLAANTDADSFGSVAKQVLLAFGNEVAAAEHARALVMARVAGPAPLPPVAQLFDAADGAGAGAKLQAMASKLAAAGHEWHAAACLLLAPSLKDGAAPTCHGTMARLMHTQVDVFRRLQLSRIASALQEVGDAFESFAAAQSTLPTGARG